MVMKKAEFFEELKEALEIEDTLIDITTNLTELDAFDSLGIMSLVALIDEHFGKSLSQEDFQQITTVQSLMDIIGQEHFEE